MELKILDLLDLRAKVGRQLFIHSIYLLTCFPNTYVSYLSGSVPYTWTIPANKTLNLP